MRAEGSWPRALSGSQTARPVRSPISNPQLPTTAPAISPRSSQRPTRIPHRRASAPYHAAALFSRRRRGEDQGGRKRTCAESLPDSFYLSRNTDTHGKEIVPIPKAALAAREPPAETNTDTALRRNEAAAQTIRRRIGGCAARKLQNAGEIGRRYSGRIKKRMFSGPAELPPEAFRGGAEFHILLRLISPADDAAYSEAPPGSSHKEFSKAEMGYRLPSLHDYAAMVRIILNCSCSPPQGKTGGIFQNRV